MPYGECMWYAVCPLRRFERQGLIDGRWRERYCKGDWASCERYHMEEAGRAHPDWLLPDGSFDERLKGR